MVDESNKKPKIVFTLNEPYTVLNLKEFTNSKGEDLDAKPVMSLCRCGHSGSKPYCDGAHAKVGFSGEKKDDRWADRDDEYEGKDITIVDNRGVCSSFGACVNGLPSVFDDKDPWAHPDGASKQEIIETIEKCPSGALSYKIDGKRYQDIDRPPAIRVGKNGPLHIEGFVVMEDDRGNTPECKEHYTLCRCGESSNKPFCDSTHLEVEWKDDKN